MSQRLALLDGGPTCPGIDPTAEAAAKGQSGGAGARRQPLLTGPPPSAGGAATFTVRFLPLESSPAAATRARALVTAYDARWGS